MAEDRPRSGILLRARLVKPLGGVAVLPIGGIVVIALAWPWVASRMLLRLKAGGVRPLASLTVVIMVTAAIGLVAWAYRRRSSLLQTPQPSRSWGTIVRVTAAAFVAATVTQLLNTGPDVGGRGAERTARLVLAVLTTATITPMVEEVIYRGVIYQAIRHRLVGDLQRWPTQRIRLRSLWPAILASSVLFGLGHYEVASLLGMFSLIGFGAVMAVAYEYTGRLWVPVLVHGTYNLAVDLGRLGLGYWSGLTLVATMLATAVVLAVGTNPAARRRFIGPRIDGGYRSDASCVIAEQRISKTP